MNLSELYHLKGSQFTSPLTYFKSVINIGSQSSKKIPRGAAMNASALSKKEITAMLRAWGAGEHEATEELIRTVYRELRLQARHVRGTNRTSIRLTDLNTQSDTEIVPAPVPEDDATLMRPVFSPDSSRVIYQRDTHNSEQMFSVSYCRWRADKGH